MSKPPIGNRNLIRAINRSAVLNAVKTNGRISRTDIARDTGLSPATISAITATLIADDLVQEQAEGDSRGGRRPILLALNPKGGFVIGLKLAETHTVGALMDLEATVLAKRTRAHEGHSPEEIVASLGEAVTELIRAVRIPKRMLLGVGLGVAGIVDGDAGLLRQSPFFGWRDVPLGEMVERVVRAPVYLDNDVNTLTIAEKWFGAGQGVDDFLTVTIGRGVGLGIVVNGRFYRGWRGGAGELGHTVVDPNGPRCGCGKRGCLETFVGDPALVRAAREQGLQVADPEDLVTLAESGGRQARAILARAGRLLGLAVADLINLFDPQLIILSGEGVRAGDWLFQPMRESIGQQVMPGLAQDTEVRVDPWDDDAWARGAGSLVLRELFESPVHRSPAVARL